MGERCGRHQAGLFDQVSSYIIEADFTLQKRPGQSTGRGLIGIARFRRQQPQRDRARRQVCERDTWLCPAAHQLRYAAGESGDADTPGLAGSTRGLDADFSGALGGAGDRDRHMRHQPALRSGRRCKRHPLQIVSDDQSVVATQLGTARQFLTRPMLDMVN